MVVDLLLAEGSCVVIADIRFGRGSCFPLSAPGTKRHLAADSITNSVTAPARVGLIPTYKTASLRYCVTHIRMLRSNY